MHRWRVMTDGEIPRPAGILEKKNLLSYPVNSRRRARERHRVLGKGRARATHERKLTERNAVCEPTPDRAAFESREGKRESGEWTEKERKKDKRRSYGERKKEILYGVGSRDEERRRGGYENERVEDRKGRREE